MKTCGKGEKRADDRNSTENFDSMPKLDPEPISRPLFPNIEKGEN
jgi:hypothetical protein